MDMLLLFPMRECKTEEINMTVYFQICIHFAIFFSLKDNN